MSPQEIGLAYDRIADWWRERMLHSTAGLTWLDRALSHCGRGGSALDVGCGYGRLLSGIEAAGLHYVGIEISDQMLRLARSGHPRACFMKADVRHWCPPGPYELILAWDSTFHLPLGDQEAVHRRLCRWLAPGGLLLFTAGGVQGEVIGQMRGEDFYYSSLPDAQYLRILNEEGCRCILLERDQFPLDHIVVIAVKEGRGLGDLRKRSYPLG